MVEEALSNHPEPYRVPDLILPSRPERWCQAASIVTQKFGKEAGEVMYRQATSVDLDCNYQYAAALWQWKRPQEAMAVLDELPENCLSMRIRGFSNVTLGLFEEAVTHLESMRDNCSMDPYARFKMASARIELDDERGPRLLQSLVNEDPKNTAYRLTFVIALERFGDLQNATQELERLMLDGRVKADQFDPDAHLRLYQLARSLERKRSSE